MYEVTYVIDGITKKIPIKGNDALAVQSVITNMYSGHKIEIIEIRRI